VGIALSRGAAGSAECRGLSGGFTREAAEYVAGTTLPLLSALVSKSLLRRTSAGRYDLHDLVRQYALDQLDRDAQAADELAPDTVNTMRSCSSDAAQPSKGQSNPWWWQY
jgi:hypothetical protein